jgi:hypothetical protein
VAQSLILTIAACLRRLNACCSRASQRLTSLYSRLLIVGMAGKALAAAAQGQTDMRSPLVSTALTRLPRLDADYRQRNARRWSASGARLVFLLALCGQMALSEPAHAAAEKERAPAEADAATVPTAFELSLLYANRTWIWKNGAAYFAKDNNRRLQAWTSSQDKASVAEGRWLVTDTGKMCMELSWRSKTYSKQGRTCYSHRIQDGKIEQRKDPDGEWYNFKGPPEEADEYRKFEEGDTKGAQFEEARKLVDSKS